MTVLFGSAFHKLDIEKRLSMELVEKHIFGLKMLFDYFVIFYFLVYFTFQAILYFGKKSTDIFKIANIDELFWETISFATANLGCLAAARIKK